RSSRFRIASFICASPRSIKEPRGIPLRQLRRDQISECLGKSEAVPQSRGWCSGTSKTPSQPPDTRSMVSLFSRDSQAQELAHRVQVEIEATCGPIAGSFEQA